MAIIFVSPKRKQKAFTWSITAALILFLFIISLMIFPPQFKNKLLNISSQEGAVVIPTVKIDFTTINSERVQGLEPFELVETEFDYIGEDQAGQKISGKISAQSLQLAKEALEATGLKVLSLTEANIGRNEPFIPYYSKK
ncbi:MAG: hypothetical protein Q7S10_02245 [bacterium]|nr:hypothetical protein [bacterium]